MRKAKIGEIDDYEWLKRCPACGREVKDDDGKHQRLRSTKDGGLEWVCGPFDNVPLVIKPGASGIIVGLK